MIREDRNDVENTVTHMTTYTAEINLYSSVKGNSYQTLFAFYALCVRSYRHQNMIREDRNNVEKTVTHRKSHIIYLSSVRGQIHVQ